MKTLDFAGLNSQLSSRSRTILVEWLPGGRFVGNEYECADIYGGSGKSCRINLDTGKWADFSNSDHRGNDFISLYATIHGISNGEAYKQLNDTYNLVSPVGSQTPSTTQTPRAKAKELEFIAPPKGTPLPFKRAEFEAVYDYRDTNGSILYFITRTKDKQFYPWSWSTLNRWHKRAWPDNRPLFNLHKLSKRPDAPVLICEGEKATLAAEEFTNNYVCVSWQGGVNAYNKTDWSPLAGRRVLIWPDADDAGRKASAQIAAKLLPIVSEVKIIDTTSYNSGFDAADFKFKSYSEFADWAKPKVSVYGQTNVSTEPPKPQQTIINNTLNVADPDDIPTKPQRTEIALWEKLGLKCNINTKIPYNNASNIKKILMRDKFLRKRLWYDEFHHKIFTDINWFGASSVPVREWSDADDVDLMTYIQDDLGLHRCTKGMVMDAVLSISKRNTRNEPRDWLESLKWDESDRVSNFFCKYFGVKDDEYTRAISKNFWISMVARVMSPGCKADNMIILEGKQGRYKSTALSIIGGKWYVETNENPNSKDFFQIFQGKMLIEIGELDSFNKAETTKIKAVVSTATDRFRPPYGRTPQDYPRQCIFVGTTNESNYLRDATGGRRFWPVSIGSIDIDALSLDREQLFAQAVSLYNSGEAWHEVPSAAAQEQELRRENDPWESVIEQYLNSNFIKIQGYVTVLSIATDASCLNIDIGRVDRLVSSRIGKILRALGWEKDKTVRENGRPSQSYIKPINSAFVISGVARQTRDLKNHAPTF